MSTFLVSKHIRTSQATQPWRIRPLVAFGTFNGATRYGSLRFSSAHVFASGGLLGIISIAQTFMMCVSVLNVLSSCVNYLYCAVNVKGAETKRPVGAFSLFLLNRM